MLTDKKEPYIEVVEVDFTNATLFFPSDTAEEFRDGIRNLLSTLDPKKTSILNEELRASAHWPKCAMAGYISSIVDEIDETEACCV